MDEEENAGLEAALAAVLGAASGHPRGPTVTVDRYAVMYLVGAVKVPRAALANAGLQRNHDQSLPE